MLRTLVTAAALLLSASAAVSAAENAPILYPHDNSQRYAYGYSGIDFPSIPVARGHSCTIMLEPGESLPPTEANGVLLDDRVRWVAVASHSGGGRVDGHAVPMSWTITVEPAHDADDAWLSVSTDRRHYEIHLVAVARNSSSAERLVGFFYYHAPPRMRVFRQARAVVGHPRQIATRHR